MLLGSGKPPGPDPISAPAGCVEEEARRVVWKCPTASLSKDTMVMLARANVTIRWVPSLPGARSLVGSTMGSMAWVRT